MIACVPPCTPLAGGMNAYNDEKWVEALMSLGLPEHDFDNARILLAGKDSGFRQGMLACDADSNKRVILKTLREFLLPLGCIDSEQFQAA